MSAPHAGREAFRQPYSTDSRTQPAHGTARHEETSSYPQPFAQSHLPPPYAPLNASRIPIDSSLLGSVSGQSPYQQPKDPPQAHTREQPQQPAYPGVMVYPPPPPHPDGNSNHSSFRGTPTSTSNDGSGRRESVQLPSMDSWAPPPTGSLSRSASVDQSPAAQAWIQAPQRQTAENDEGLVKVERGQKRRPSDAEEVEASIALAGMGMSLAPSTTGGKKSSTAAAKKVKKEDSKRGDNKDNRKSCSECRRLKAKCDRVFPCSNCVRRGCALVCPEGDLSCMRGKRLVLASTEQLHERISLLETALSQAHSKVTSSQHPLLAPQYLDGGFASQPPPALPGSANPLPSLSPPARKPDADNLLPNHASSTSSHVILTPDVSSERFNPSSRMAVESLLRDGHAAAAEGKREDEWVGENAPPAMIVGNLDYRALGAGTTEHQLIVDRLRKILRAVPPREETRRRADHFWSTSTWYSNILAKKEFDAIYEPAVYAPTKTNPLSPHKLACVLMVLTLDTYFDPSMDEESQAVADYWDAAQRCFDTRFGWAASVAGVQALGLAALFVGFGWRGARASNFYWLRLMTSAALQLGLHKDPHSSLPEDEREFRRRVFWDCYAIDCLMSINHGQRAGIPIENIETVMPRKNVSPLHQMKFEYMRSVKSAVIDIGCLPDKAPASWEKIAETDQILRQYDVMIGPHLHCPILSDKITPSMASDPAFLDAAAMTRSTTSMCHYKAMMFLYRPSLRQLISRLRSQPAESITFSDADRQTVSMTYHACHSITAISLYMSRTHPILSARCWPVWVQTFSAAVSMTALAIWCGPHLEPTFIGAAYNELKEACDMIKENGSKRSQGVLSLLPILQTLVHNRFPQVIGKDPSTATVSSEGEDMLFALLGGQVGQKDSGLADRGMRQSENQAPIKAPENQSNPHFAHSAADLSSYSQQQHVNGWHSIPQMPSQTHESMHGYPMSFDTDMGHVQGQQHVFDGMNTDEVWARLQTFYEPTPAFWGQQDMSYVNWGEASMAGSQ